MTSLERLTKFFHFSESEIQLAPELALEDLLAMFLLDERNREAAARSTNLPQSDWQLASGGDFRVTTRHGQA